MPSSPSPSPVEPYQEAAKAACDRCNDRGLRHPHCFRCDDSTDDHVCPDPVPCDHAEARRHLARALPFIERQVAERIAGELRAEADRLAARAKANPLATKGSLLVLRDEADRIERGFGGDRHG